MALFFLASLSAVGASGDKTNVKGMITSRTGETLIVKTSEGSTTVVLTDDTTTKDDKGLFGLEKLPMAESSGETTLWVSSVTTGTCRPAALSSVSIDCSSR